jgi:fatty-acid desaturase
MKLPNEKTGLSTVGLAGCIVLAGVIFGSLNPWWLVLAGFFIISAIGHEIGKR